jgi:putative nucleotidyltransferase with HDIG domain
MKALTGCRRSECRRRHIPWVLRSAEGVFIFGAVLGHSLVIVSDAHLGVASSGVEDALLEFLDAVPALGDCLLINGDLFDFWFTYSRVIPRRGFHVAASLARLRRQIPIVMVGGNHDRWDSGFWQRDLGLNFHPLRATFQLGDRTVTAIHGDGLTEPRWQARLIHRLIQHPATATVYQFLHPDFGLRLVDLLSPMLGDHTVDETKLARAGARQREWAERLLADEPQVEFGFLLHDIGKVAVPDAILFKPERLTDVERAVMERHTIVGWEILRDVDFLAEAKLVVRHHHERWDGAGYPDGLAGEQIPLEARIIFVCDAFHAMTSDRPYRAAMPQDEAIRRLLEAAGTQFDPEIVRVFVDLHSRDLIHSH